RATPARPARHLRPPVVQGPWEGPAGLLHPRRPRRVLAFASTREPRRGPGRARRGRRCALTGLSRTVQESRSGLRTTPRSSRAGRRALRDAFSRLAGCRARTARPRRAAEPGRSGSARHRSAPAPSRPDLAGPGWRHSERRHAFGPPPPARGPRRLARPPERAPFASRCPPESWPTSRAAPPAAGVAAPARRPGWSAYRSRRPARPGSTATLDSLV